MQQHELFEFVLDAFAELAALHAAAAAAAERAWSILARFVRPGDMGMDWQTLGKTVRLAMKK